MTNELSRRNFVKAGAVAAGMASSLASSRALGANEQIRCAFVGTANRGGQLIKAALEHEQVQFRKHMRSFDMAEGLRAFSEKREPRFQGR